MSEKKFDVALIASNKANNVSKTRALGYFVFFVAALFIAAESIFPVDSTEIVMLFRRKDFFSIFMLMFLGFCGVSMFSYLLIALVGAIKVVMTFGSARASFSSAARVGAVLEVHVSSIRAPAKMEAYKVAIVCSEINETNLDTRPESAIWWQEVIVDSIKQERGSRFSFSVNIPNNLPPTRTTEKKTVVWSIQVPLNVDAQFKIRPIYSTNYGLNCLRLEFNMSPETVKPREV